MEFLSPPATATVNNTDFLFLHTKTKLFVYHVTETSFSLAYTVEYSSSTSLGLLLYEAAGIFVFQHDSELVTAEISTGKTVSSVDLTHLGNTSAGGFIGVSCDSSEPTVVVPITGDNCQIVGFSGEKQIFSIPICSYGSQ